MRTVVFVIGGAIVGFVLGSVLTIPLASAPSILQVLIVLGSAAGVGFYGFKQAQKGKKQPVQPA